MVDPVDLILVYNKQNFTVSINMTLSTSARVAAWSIIPATGWASIRALAHIKWRMKTYLYFLFCLIFTWIMLTTLPAVWMGGNLCAFGIRRRVNFRSVLCFRCIFILLFLVFIFVNILGLHFIHERAKQMLIDWSGFFLIQAQEQLLLVHQLLKDLTWGTEAQ